ncbi:MAG: sialidase family protein [Planctomycetota bacterium]
MTDRLTAPIRVNNPRRLPRWQIDAKRIPIGRPGDYKPSLVFLPGGGLLMVAFHQTGTQGKSDFHEVTTFWRSDDGGATWSDRDDRRDVIGREQFLSRTRAGTLFMSSHILAADNAYDGPKSSYHSYLHRSTDDGKTWQRTRVRLEGEERRGVPETNGTTTDRNVVELPDGALLFGVALDNSSVACMWRSTDNGESWDRNRPCHILGYYDNADGFFSNSFTYLNEAGILLHFPRVGHPSPMTPMNDGRPVPLGDDHCDRMMWTKSADDGAMWSRVADFADYGQMYPRVLKLHDGRLLLTFTQRGMNCPLGLRAILSCDDGETWDFHCDQIVIEGFTPWGAPSGGGFGNTVQLHDGTLVSCYSYMGPDENVHVEVARWRLP